MRKYVLLIVACVQISWGQTWVIKLNAFATVLGDALASNPLDANIIYGVPGGRQMWVSRNRGYSWQAYGYAVSQVGSSDNVIKSIAVNPRDTLQILVGVESNNSNLDRIMKTTNGGTSWTQTWGGSFSYYGKPVEFKPIHPDTVYTMGNDTLWRSVDFGSTWDTIRTTTGLFSAWCDAEIRPDSANVMLLGDYTTGIWKTQDYGHTWRKVFATDGEIPSIAIDPFNPRIAYATRFAGGGGVIKSINGGETWNSIPTPIGGGPGWWITCSPVNRGYVYFGVYGANPPGIYVSADSGSSWRNFNAGLGPNGVVNYGLLALDSLSVVASQINGIFRLQYPASVHLDTPNGGEVWQGGNAHQISWTAANCYSIKIDFSTNNGSSWTPVADHVPPGASPYNWTSPQLLSYNCRMRVSDDLVPGVADGSDTTFTLYTDPLALSHPHGGEQWFAGSSRIIDWVSYGIQEVNVDYSTDNGSSWNYITKRPASTGSYHWIVPESPSSVCKIRISDAADSTLFRVSDSVFSIRTAERFRGSLLMTDANTARDSVQFGSETGGTDGIDSAFGEVPLPPKPGKGTFDMRWRIPDGRETKVDIRDTLNIAQPEHKFSVEIQPSAGGYPVTIAWNPESLRAGTYILRDTLTHGFVYNADMRNTGGLTIGDTTVSALELIECRSLRYTYQGDGGWLLMSLGLDVGDRRKGTLFPNSISNAFSYSGGYVRSDALKPGIGYWLKSQQTSIIGCPLTLDTIALASGWNMIGSLSSAVSVASIVAIPDTLLSSPYFEYANSYTVADSIRPGKGYWIRARGPGRLVLSLAPTILPKRIPARNTAEDFNALNVEDEAGHNQLLFFGSENSRINADFYELPPAAPPGVFEAYFGSRRRAAVHPPELKKPLEFPLLVSSGSAKLNFSWRVDNERNFAYILVEMFGGKEAGEVQLTGRGKVVVEGADRLTFRLRVQEATGKLKIPGEFSLGEMYPNPFNPVTHVSYTLPSDADVRILVYDILGSEVTRLAEGVQKAGTYRTDWPGTTLGGTPVSSGVYYVSMTASPLPVAGQSGASYSAVRKVLLIR